MVDVGLPTTLNTEAGGERKLIPITGGSFSGAITGEILAGGSDAVIIRPDGCAVLNARYCLAMDNGNTIYVKDRGYRHGPDAIMRRLAQGDAVDPKKYYFRTCMTMETGDKDYAWLNKTLFIGSGCRRAQQVVIDLYQIN